MEEFTGKSNTSGSYEIYSYRKASFGIRMAPTGTTLRSILGGQWSSATQHPGNDCFIIRAAESTVLTPTYGISYMC